MKKMYSPNWIMRARRKNRRVHPGRKGQKAAADEVDDAAGHDDRPTLYPLADVGEDEEDRGADEPGDQALGEQLVRGEVVGAHEEQRQVRALAVDHAAVGEEPDHGEE